MHLPDERVTTQRTNERRRTREKAREKEQLPREGESAQLNTPWNQQLLDWYKNQFPIAFYARSGQQAISAIMAFDPKLIPLFDGTDAGQSVVEWVEKAELVCRLSGVKHIECVVPMRLSVGAYAVYQ